MKEPIHPESYRQLKALVFLHGYEKIRATLEELQRGGYAATDEKGKPRG